MPRAPAAHPRAEYSRRLRELIESERESTSSPASAERYVRQHARRFDITFDLCCRLVPDTGAVVCDVGRSSFTERLARRYADVWSLGFGLQEDDGGHREQKKIDNSRHILFNLNASRDVSDWPNVDVAFDLIVCAETIEHLHTPPEFTFLMLRSLLKPGGLLLVTTPNACGITRRIQFLFGANPFERIRYYARNPGHFREYTRREMVDMGFKAGLEVRECRTVNFYRSRRPIVNCLKWPAPFRDSLVAVYAAP
jgi:2-polyprenyl-3-methyl-5-hydroxy-6-metoxy-1,4-benzoquinol methylase